MTTASKGLQRALARGSSTVAIAEMSVADLFAEMSDDQKAELAAQITAPAAAAVPAQPAGNASDEGGDGEEEGDKKKPKKPTGTPDDADANASASRVKAVAQAVATDDSCKGKGAQALAMLADDDFAGLSASGIVKLLGTLPRDDHASITEAQRAAAEASGREEMRAALNSVPNSNIDAGGAGKPDKRAAADAVWDRARATIDQKGTK